LANPARPQGAGDNGPSASRRDDSDNGTCPAMPGAAGPGNGAARRCAAIPDFLCDRSAEASWS